MIGIPAGGVKIVRRDAARDAKIVGQIQAVVRSQRIDRAVELARAALDDGTIHPMLLNLRSHWHSQQGRPNEALADLQTAIALDPRDIFVRNALGVLLERMGRWSEAIPILEETVRMAPNFAPAQYALGWLYAFTGELDAARACFETAIAAEPNFADALAQLASLASRRADWPTTDQLCRRALAISPTHPVALTALAAAALAQRQLYEAESLLDRIGDVALLPPLERSLAETVRGDLRDAQGRYAEAFGLYAARNRQTFELAAPQFDLKGATANDYVRWLAGYFAQVPDKGWAGGPNPPPKAEAARGHVFLVGFPRSGTTLLENILASHPGIRALDERDTLGVAAKEFLAGEEGRDRLAALTEQEIEKHRAIYWQRVRDFGADVRGKIYLDKYPLTSIKLPLVAKLFPDARILFALRDPRDVMLSCFRRSFSLNPSMFELLDLERGARLYAGVMELSALYRAKLGLAWHTLHYKSLVADFGMKCAPCAISSAWRGMRKYSTLPNWRKIAPSRHPVRCRCCAVSIAKGPGSGGIMPRSWRRPCLTSRPGSSATVMPRPRHNNLPCRSRVR